MSVSARLCFCSFAIPLQRVTVTAISPNVRGAPCDGKEVVSVGIDGKAVLYSLKDYLCFFSSSWRSDTAAMVCCQTPRSLRRGDLSCAPLLAAALLSLLLAGMQQTTAFPSWRLEEEAYTTVLLIGIRKEARSQVLHLSRNKRYTLTPEQLKWDKFKLTYKYLFHYLLENEMFWTVR